MTDDETGDPAGTNAGRPLDRRTVLKTTGAVAALSAGAGLASAQEGSPGPGGEGTGEGPPDAAGGGPPAGTWPATDPVFGLPSAGPNPCSGDASTDCFDAFGPPVRPDAEVEMHVDLPGVLLAVAEQGVLSGETTASINEAAADGSVEGDDDVLHGPDTSLSVSVPGGGSRDVTVREIAALVSETAGFHFDPAGLRVRPGDVVLFSAETPDHAVAAYHERHGRQNRVPDGVGPLSSPLVPVGGYWLYRFDVEGVYDLYCPPHQTLGMAMRIVVADGGEVPAPSVEQTGRPPQSGNAIAGILGGLDPNLPSSMDVLAADALAPANVVENGSVSWETVVAEHRG
jgi:plastocyanin